MATSQRKGMRMPLAKPILRCDRHLQLLVGGTYGYTRAVKNTKKFHGGVDLYAEPGTDCFAIYYGSVKSILKGKDFGNRDHQNRFPGVDMLGGVRAPLQGAREPRDQIRARDDYRADRNLRQFEPALSAPSFRDLADT